MAKYTIKRLLLLIPTLFIVCVIVFALLRMIPGTALDQIMYKYSTAGIEIDREAVAAKLGMDKPAVEQFFIWVGGLLKGNLGDSLFQSESVGSIIARQLPVTLELGILTLILTNVISIPLGLFCAARQDAISDQTIRVISVILMSLPVFWIGTLVLIYPAKWWGYAPATMYVPFLRNPLKNLSMFIVPALLGAMTQAGSQIRMVRTMTLEVMRQDYIRTAWSKGVGERRILFRHAFRNALIPVITIIGSSVAGLVGGSVILENMFSLPGIGQQMVNALSNRDYPLVQGCVLVFSIFVMLVNLIVDLAYKIIDPRVEIE
jgi:peptide/nickel transport system permease protein